MIIRYFYLILLLTIFSTSYSQKFTIGNDIQNIVYVGLPAPLNLTVQGYNNNQLIVTTDNGRIINEYGRFILVPSTIGKVTITIKAKSNNKIKKIGEAFFRVKDIPEPIFKIGSGRDSMQAVEISAQQFARVDDSDPACWDLCNYKLDSFKIQIISRNALVFEHTNIGSKLDDIIRKGFNLLIPGDLILVTNIFATSSNGRKRKAKSVIWTVY